MAKKTTVHIPVTKSLGLTPKLRRNLPSITLLLIGLVAGILWFGALRYLLKQDTEIHYHSDYAVFIDGKREEFKSFTYYEEVAACTTAFADNPKGRAHMHNNVNDVIHVHDNAVTYSDYFVNIDWSIGPDFVRTSDGLLQKSDEKSWVYVLNGEKIDRIDNLVIRDKDMLLLSYGTADTDYTAQYKTIEGKAEHVDEQSDPASCSGLNGPHDNSFPARLKKAFSFED